MKPVIQNQMSKHSQHVKWPKNLILAYSKTIFEKPNKKRNTLQLISPPCGRPAAISSLDIFRARLSKYLVTDFPPPAATKTHKLRGQRSILLRYQSSLLLPKKGRVIVTLNFRGLMITLVVFYKSLRTYNQKGKKKLFDLPLFCNIKI